MELTKVCNVPIEPEVVNEYEFTLYRRTTFRVLVTFKQPNGNPLDITNYEVKFYIVENDGSSILTILSNSLTLNGSTINILDSINGKVEILITDEETTLITQSVGKWWMTILPLNGDELLRGKGSIKIKNPYE